MIFLFDLGMKPRFFILHPIHFLLMVSLFVGTLGAADPSLVVYIGTYTGKASKGIYTTRLDPKTGALTPVTLAAETPSPSFLALNPKAPFLYAVNEVNKFQDKASGGVTAFAIDRATGKLTELNAQPSGGAGPCHVAVDATGSSVLVANYGGGSVSAYPIQRDGGLGAAASFIQHRGSSVDSRRQGEPHAHHVTMDRGNQFALVSDLGLDKIMVYRLDAKKGLLTPNDPPAGIVEPGSGPRHLAFGRSGRYAYVINEMQCSVTALQFDPNQGTLASFQTISTLPGEKQSGYSTAELVMRPDGKFLYGSNRGHDSIVVYSVDRETGKLQVVQHQATLGKTPRSFGIDPLGRWLLAANQSSDTIVVFAIDPASGQLRAVGEPVAAPTPVSVVFTAP